MAHPKEDMRIPNILNQKMYLGTFPTPQKKKRKKEKKKKLPVFFRAY